MNAQTSRRHESSAFTLVELLVSIAIMAILLSIMVPSIAGMVDQAKKAKCAKNMQGLAKAWLQYARDNDGFIPCSNTGNNRFEHGQRCWIEWGRWTIPEGEAAIKRGGLFPYTGSVKMYRCTNPVWDYASSYSMNANLNGERTTDNAESVRASTRQAYKISHIRDTARTFLFMEEDDWRGLNMNSWDTNGINRWWDYVAGNHNMGDNIAFTDGHVEYRRWEDPDTLSLSYGNFGKSDSGSVDLRYIETIRFPRTP